MQSLWTLYATLVACGALHSFYGPNIFHLNSTCVAVWRRFLSKMIKNGKHRPPCWCHLAVPGVVLITIKYFTNEDGLGVITKACRGELKWYSTVRCVERAVEKQIGLQKRKVTKYKWQLMAEEYEWLIILFYTVLLLVMGSFQFFSYENWYRGVACFKRILSDLKWLSFDDLNITEEWNFDLGRDPISFADFIGTLFPLPAHS